MKREQSNPPYVTVRGFVSRGGQKSLTRVERERQDKNPGLSPRWGGEEPGRVRIARNLLVPVQVWRNEIVKFQSTLEALSTGVELLHAALSTKRNSLPLPSTVPSTSCSSFLPEEDVRFLPLFGADSSSAGKKKKVN